VATDVSEEPPAANLKLKEKNKAEISSNDLVETYRNTSLHEPKYQM
jgi:hypothetical protein